MPNQHVNKVTVNGADIIDLTADTVTPATLLSGYTAHDKSGAQITGTADGGAAEGHVWQDAEGYLVLSDGSAMEYQSKSKTYTPTESQQSETISPDSGYDGLSSVSVTVNAISPTYVGSGVHVIDETDDDDVYLRGDGRVGKSVCVAEGYSYGFDYYLPDGTVEEPTATKGTVSNHSVSVTPSVDISEGYIFDGTFEGTAVTVTASELVSGTYTVSSSGSHNVTNYASASVAAGSVDTPTILKGTVSDNAVTVRPDVNFSAGYIGAGGKTGSAVTIAASELVSGTKSISGNGTGIDVTNYASVDVAVPTGTARSSSDLTASGATVTVPAGLYSTDATKTIASGSATPASSISATGATVTAGTNTLTLSKTVSNTPQVSAGYISSGTAGNSSVSLTASVNTRSSSDLTASGATVTAPAGYYASAASKSVASGSVSAPTASKGTVSSHSVSVTPSVNYGEGYISGGTRTGESVTVSASELVSGTKSITANGTGIDVTNYASVDVAVGAGMPEEDLKNYIQRSGNFTDIDWPDGMTLIGAYAFASCSNFHPLSIPDTVRVINGYAFYSCTNLAVSSLPSALVSIYDYAFAFCSGLTLTSLPSGVTNIASYAFYNCQNLALTSLPSGVTSIPRYSFASCYHLELASLPSGVTSIGSYAFYQCYRITLTTLPSGLTSIDSYAFSQCSGIESISCNGTITSIGSNAFTGSTTYQMTLASASFPNAIASSNYFGTVFGSTTVALACKQLAFCDIGSQVGINANAFANCYSLETLVLRKTESACVLSNVSAFLNTPMRGYDNKTGTVYVPQALISSYQTASNWSTLYQAGTVTFAAIEGSDYELED